MSGQNEETTRRPRRKWVFLSLVILASAVAGGVITTVAQCFMIKHYAHRFETIDQKTAEKRAERLANRLARKVNATPQQKEKLVQISKSLATDILPYRDKIKESRGQLRGLLVAEKVDREKIETYRAEKLALMDTVSKRVSVAIADASEVLTPEQRKKLGERFFRHGFDRR